MTWLDQTINHTFPSGRYFGMSTHWMLSAGARAGIRTDRGMLVYGLASRSWLNLDLNMDFGGPVTSENKTLPGFTLGGGIEIPIKRVFNPDRPVKGFVQYQHSWWDDADLTRPVASPRFNYRFSRHDGTVVFGVRVPMGRRGDQAR